MVWRALGDLQIARVVETDGPLVAPTELCPQATRENLAADLDWLEPRALCPDTGMLIAPVQSFVVRTGGATLLIDTCIGNHKSDRWHMPWYRKTDDTFLRGMAALGVTLEEVDYVFCTHLHVDHCGWHTRWVDGRWEPTFANASYVFAQSEFDYAEQLAATRKDTIFEENVLPVVESGRAHFVSSDYELGAHVKLMPTPGHTPGHVSVQIESNHQRAVVTGDLIHSPLQCGHPDWQVLWDVDPVLACETRQGFLERHCDADVLVLASHFPSPSLGHLRSARGRIDFQYADGWGR